MNKYWILDPMGDEVLFTEEAQKRVEDPLWRDIKPATDYYHYSNPEAQGSLICCTSGFPRSMPEGMRIESAYSDRMHGWDREHFTKLCDMIGGGDGVWGYKMKGLGDEKLREIGKFAFHLDSLPEHVRVVHYFNVATGYSCPTIEVIVKNVSGRVPRT